MNFGEAIEALKSGKRVRRADWYSGMWIAYMPSVTIDEGLVNGRTRKFVPTGDLHVTGYVVMGSENGLWGPGWTASQGDMFSEDWSIVEEVSSGEAPSATS